MITDVWMCQLLAKGWLAGILNCPSREDSPIVVVECWRSGIVLEAILDAARGAIPPVLHSVWGTARKLDVGDDHFKQDSFNYGKEDRSSPFMMFKG